MTGTTEEILPPITVTTTQVQHPFRRVRQATDLTKVQKPGDTFYGMQAAEYRANALRIVGVVESQALPCPALVVAPGLGFPGVAGVVTALGVWK